MEEEYEEAEEVTCIVCGVGNERTVCNSCENENA